MKKIIAVSLLVVAMAALLLGCGQAKLTSQEVKGGVTSLQMDLPFTLEQQPKRQRSRTTMSSPSQTAASRRPRAWTFT